MSVVAIIDIDTTLADNDHRAALLKYEGESIAQESWDQFLREDLMRLDKPVEHARNVLDFMRAHDYQLVFLTGRNERLNEVTSYWLQQHMGWDPLREPLIMRPMMHKAVPASVFKEEAFLSFVRDNQLERSNFLFFEDDSYVLHVWQKYGLVFKCPEAWASLNPVTLEGNEPAWKR
ncbi:hypothetical protein HC928_00030 [bacterium]|nr:hypothetical protein [bacterium]